MKRGRINNSVAFNRATNNIEHSLKLIQKIKADLLNIKKLLAEAREGSVVDIGPYCKQGELFDYGPEINERLSRHCLGALVETL
jgi:hypothetical protein